MNNRPPTPEDLNRLPTEEDLNRLQITTLRYYLHETNPANGLIRDKTDSIAPASIAAVGLGLAASYPYWGYPGYAYGDGCLVPRRVWTPWGPRVRWINVCY